MQAVLPCLAGRLSRTSRAGQDAVTPHGGDMTGIRTAASADQGEVRQPRTQRVLGPGELDGIALVEIGGSVELLVAAGRRVRAESDNARAPLPGRGQRLRDVAGMRA